MSCVTTTAAPCRGNDYELVVPTAAVARSGPEELAADVERLLSVARSAGMLVTLDAQIGRERYQSVAGSVMSLQRFANALRQIMLDDRAAR